MVDQVTYCQSTLCNVIETKPKKSCNILHEITSIKEVRQWNGLIKKVLETI